MGAKSHSHLSKGACRARVNHFQAERDKESERASILHVWDHIVPSTTIVPMSTICCAIDPFVKSPWRTHDLWKLPWNCTVLFRGIP